MKMLKIIQTFPIPGNWRAPLDDEDGVKK